MLGIVGQTALPNILYMLGIVGQTALPNILYVLGIVGQTALPNWNFNFLFSNKFLLSDDWHFV